MSAVATKLRAAAKKRSQTVAATVEEIRVKLNEAESILDDCPTVDGPTSRLIDVVIFHLLTEVFDNFLPGEQEGANYRAAFTATEAANDLLAAITCMLSPQERADGLDVRLAHASILFSQASADLAKLAPPSAAEAPATLAAPSPEKVASVAPISADEDDPDERHHNVLETVATLANAVCESLNDLNGSATPKMGGTLYLASQAVAQMGALVDELIDFQVRGSASEWLA